METTYKRATSGKRKVGCTPNSKGGEKRRLIQLVASLVLFLLVFAGSEAFPLQVSNYGELLKADMNFSESFQSFWNDVVLDEPFLQSLVPGPTASQAQELETHPDRVSDKSPESTELPEVILLGETDLRGLAYLRQNGFAVYSDAEKVKGVQAETEIPTEPVTLTATAQAFNAEGEKLPSNVSYQYYDLGLSQTALPVTGPVTSGFEYRKNPLTGKREFHLALDIAAAEGTGIAAFADGVVRYIGESDEFGLYFMIDHANGVSTFYAHCSKLYVRKGDSVSCGQTVALVGRTGNVTGAHLHFTILKDNIRLDPAHYVNP